VESRDDNIEIRIYKVVVDFCACKNVIAIDTKSSTSQYVMLMIADNGGVTVM
jgi:hypothetical protein